MGECYGRVAILAIVKGGIHAVGRTGGVCRAAIDRDAVADQDISRPLFEQKERSFLSKRLKFIQYIVKWTGDGIQS